MKTKRIVSFCSLFSLVLILSVYYVLSPITFTQDMNVNSSVESDDVIVDIVDGESAYFDNLNVLKQNAFLEEIKELEAIVASSNTSSEEKIAALEVKNEKIKMNEKEKQLSLMIKEKGYSNVYVEYEDKKVNILVSKDKASKADALGIMRTVYSSIGVGYTPSVMFKS